MKTYYFALILLWLCWECDLSFTTASKASVNTNLIESENVSPPIAADAADSLKCIAAVSVAPLSRLNPRLTHE